MVHGFAVETVDSNIMIHEKSLSMKTMMNVIHKTKSKKVKESFTIRYVGVTLETLAQCHFSFRKIILQLEFF